ncbi:MAG: S-layer homology domain-containing protein, partial [Actinobacteria bacterium]|nr:S-layer homology domain-containing protein [Actinomycetota bacterium]
MMESQDHTHAALVHVARLAVFILAVGLAIGVLGGGIAQAADHWTDISDAQWLSQYNVSAEQAATVAQGYSNGDGTWRFEWKAAVTRGQFAKMAVNGLGLGELNPPTATFKDVPTGSTFFTFVERAAASGLVNGWVTPDGRYFRPGESISRQQANSILGRYLSDAELDTSGSIQGVVSTYPSLQAWYDSTEGDFYLKAFTDWGTVAVDHRPATAYLIYHGVVKGHAGLLNPTSTLTRAQAVALILRVEHEVQTIVQPPTPPTGVATVPVSPSSNRAPYVVGQTIVDGVVAVYDTFMGVTTQVATGNADSTGAFSVHTPTLAEGLHSFTVKVKNEHNMVSGASAAVPYLVDLTKPTGSFTTPVDGGAVASLQPHLLLTAADTGSGVRDVLFQYRAGTTGEFQTISTDGSAPFEAGWGDLNLPGEGQYQFRAQVHDNAGNEQDIGPIS